MVRFITEFAVAFGFAWPVGFAFSLLSGEEIVLTDGQTVMLVIACSGYAAMRVNRPGSKSKPWGRGRHFCAALGVCFGAQLAVMVVMQEDIRLGGFGLLAYVIVSFVHSLRAVAPIELMGRTNLLIYGGAAAFLLPLFIFAPRRTAVREDFDALWQVLNEQLHTFPATLEREHRSEFMARAEKMAGWPEFMAKNDGLAVYPMTARMDAGLRGVGRDTHLTLSFAECLPGTTPGDFETTSSPCVEVVLDVVVEGNYYLPGRLVAVVTTGGRPHEDLFLDHLNSLLVEFDVVPTIVAAGAE